MRHILKKCLIAGLCTPILFCQNDLASQNLTDAEKLYTLSLLWSEAKYNFVYFDQVPELDWEAAYQETIPKVLASSDLMDYYRTLIRFTARLGDGHTQVWLPESLWRELDQPPLELAEIEGKPVVRAVARELEGEIPLASQILAVDGIPAIEFVEANSLPYVSASTSHVRLDRAIRGNWSGGYGLLLRPRGTEISVRFRTPQGAEMETMLTCDRSDSGEIDWVRLSRPSGLLEWRWMEGDIAYVALNSFNDADIVTEFEAILPELQRARGILIDLRFNGGGSTGNATAILDHFTDQALVGSKWKTREHRGFHYAWGRGDPDSPYRDNYGSLDGWFEGGTMTMRQTSGPKLKVPVVVLIDYFTASAAEDFLVFAAPLKHFTTVGRPTNGSTGQPIFYSLPGGGRARICAKRDTYPDGRDFVGIGIQPDIPVAPTIESLAAGRDVMLETALKAFP